MTLNGVMALILRFFTDFGYSTGQLRHSVEDVSVLENPSMLSASSSFPLFTTLHACRHGIAMRILSVFLSVCLSDKCMHFDKMDERSVQMFDTIRKII